jgi:single-stranded DNA-binding protein
MGAPERNTIELVGTVASVRPLRRGADGRPLLSFSIATLPAQDARGRRAQPAADRHECVAWGPAAEALAVCCAGAPIAVSGALGTRIVEDRAVKLRLTTVNVLHVATPAPGTARNHVELVGRVREQPKWRAVPGATPQAIISLATRTPGSVAGREDWHIITLQGRAAELARSTQPGDTVAVSGCLRQRGIDRGSRPQGIAVVEADAFRIIERAKYIEPPAAGPATRGRDPRGRGR